MGGTNSKFAEAKIGRMENIWEPLGEPCGDALEYKAEVSWGKQEVKITEKPDPMSFSNSNTACWTLRTVSTYNNVSEVVDNRNNPEKGGERVALAKGSSSFGKSTVIIYRFTPSFKGQADAGAVDASEERPLYKFATIHCEQTAFKDPSATLAMEQEAEDPVFILQGSKLSGMRGLWLVETIGKGEASQCIAKMQSTSFLGKEMKIDIGEGADPILVSMMLNCLAYAGADGGGGSAGALAGAGVT